MTTMVSGGFLSICATLVEITEHRGWLKTETFDEIKCP